MWSLYKELGLISSLLAESFPLFLVTATGSFQGKCHTTSMALILYKATLRAAGTRLVLLLCNSSRLAAGKAHQTAQFCHVLQDLSLSPGISYSQAEAQPSPLLLGFPKQQGWQGERGKLPFLGTFSRLDLSLLFKANVSWMAQQAPSIKGLFLSRPGYSDRNACCFHRNSLCKAFHSVLRTSG